MVLTRAERKRLFDQEAQRLSSIDWEFSFFGESETTFLVHRPIFLCNMEEQFVHTLVKEQIKSLPKFSGSPSEDVIKWLKDVETIFDRAQLQPSNKYLAVQFYLSDAADKWFRHNKPTLPDWSTFKDGILKDYRPSLHNILLKMENRNQSSNETVMEYYCDKLELCLQADSTMSSAMIVHHLTKGLKPSLLPHVIRRHPTTSAEFLTIAQDEEKIQATVHGLSHMSLSSSEIYLGADDRDHHDDMVALARRPPPVHFHPTRFPHGHSLPPPLMQSSSPNPRRSFSQFTHSQSSSSPPSNSRQCYNCHQFGHIARFCPNRKNI